MPTVPADKGDVPASTGPVHASERVADWLAQWQRTGSLVLLLDFDGTLAPIVAHPELAAILPAARGALRRLQAAPGIELAVVSGRAMADVRAQVGLERVAYAGNHGMEIEGPGLHQIHAEAMAARPVLEAVAEAIRLELDAIPGALLEDKGMTLSVHYRMVPDTHVKKVRELVMRAAADRPGARITKGKKVLEIRPRVKWDKGKAVLFLLDWLRPPVGTPVLYVGDDVTDEDAFRVLVGKGEGVLVADVVPASTAARSYLRSPGEVAELLGTLADSAP